MEFHAENNELGFRSHRGIAYYVLSIDKTIAKLRHKVNSQRCERLPEAFLLKAAVYRGPREINIEDVPEPRPAGKQVIVRFKAGSICGTDLHFYRGEWATRKGRILGHDACGVRDDTGERVVMVPLSYCGQCYFCHRGLPTYCERYGQFRGIDRNGFFAERIAISPKYLVPIPKNVSDEEASIMEPVALALHVMEKLKPNFGDYATILGQGPIGLLMTQVAGLKGCRVIAVDTNPNRLEFAKRYGAEFTFNPDEEDIVKRVREITVRGSDVVVEAAGRTRAVEKTPFLVRKAGRVALVGEFKGRMNFGNADDARFFTTYISPAEYPLAVELVARKRVDVKGLITHKFPLRDFEEAIKTADTAACKPLKVVINQ
jgi:threonine dehydrogenase-like Zn-dependent dehydrogenase